MDIYLQRLKNALPEKYITLVKECDCWVAGGAVLSMVMGTEVNDFDIYFKSKYDAYDFYMELNGLTISVTDKSVVVKKFVGKNCYIFNLIFFKFFNYAQEIFDSFDFTCCKAAFTGRKFIYDPKFFRDVASRRIEYTSDFRYPIASLLRVHKYKEKGFTISRNEMLKIIFQITQHPINSIKDLEEELGSIYGISLSKIYPKDEEFSIPRLIDVISNLEVDLFEATEGQDIVETPEIFKEIEREIDERDFKELYSKDLLYQNDKFLIKYPTGKGEIMNEGKEMSHCIGSYISSVLKGKCKILFMRLVDNPNTPQVTIDLRGDKIVAALRKYNNSMLPEQAEFLEEYCKVKGFKYEFKNLMKRESYEKYLEYKLSKGDK